MERSTGTPNISSCILYRNEAKSVTLLDVPTSISLAQGQLGNSPNLCIQSCEPRHVPYSSTEPHTAKAKANIEARMGPSLHDAIYRKLMKTALKNVRDDYGDDWHRPRRLPLNADADNPGPLDCIRKRRSTSDSGIDPKAQAYPQLPSPFPSRQTALSTRSPQPKALLLTKDPSTHPTATLAHRPVVNPFPTPTSLDITDSNTTYHIPPHSTFLWHSISAQHSQSYHAALNNLVPACTSSAGPGQFDAIILDPPWSNRSARRGKFYVTSSARRSRISNGDGKPGHSLADPFEVLEDVLGEHIAPNGLVLCWITHKKSARDAVMRSWRRWGVELEEEWVWAKVTAKGEPVVALDGMWRKPWEVCLVGRKRGDGGVCVDAEEEVEEERTDEVENVKRRILIAVPDIHSRKPCLKELLDGILPEHEDARVLEVFARHLVAGWFSWGDEVLKFQWKEHWTRIGGDP